jgi:hypothetical protein
MHGLISREIKLTTDPHLLTLLYIIINRATNILAKFFRTTIAI